MDWEAISKRLYLTEALITKYMDKINLQQLKPTVKNALSKEFKEKYAERLEKTS
jgi:hypothetical protein